MKPDFLVIGGRKCGTTWLYQQLLAHPDVSVSRKVKESQYFSKNFGRGPQWYSNLFDAGVDATVAGEVDTSLLDSEVAAGNIRQVCPGVKLLVVLRNPVELYLSSYLHEQRKGRESSPIERAWYENDIYRKETLYFDRLAPYVRRFPVRQMHFLLYDDLTRDAFGFYSTVCNIIGVRPLKASFGGSAKINPGRSSGYPKTSFMLTRMAGLARSLGLHSLVNRVKSSGFYQSLFREKGNDFVVPDKLARDIYLHCREDLKQLSSLIDKDLDSFWFGETAVEVGK